MTRVGSLYSGVGGLDLAAEQALGAQTVWQLDRIGAEVRRRHWPDTLQVEADVADVSPELAERILATPADGITAENDAYMLLANLVQGYRDQDVPPEVLTAGRDALRLDDDDDVAHGFL